MKTIKSTGLLFASALLASALVWSLSASEDTFEASPASAAAVEMATGGPADFTAETVPAFDPTNEVRCFHCGSGSKGKCPKGHDCYGERSDCQKKGCRISSHSSKCSTAGNAPPRC